MHKGKGSNFLRLISKLCRTWAPFQPPLLLLPTMRPTLTCHCRNTLLAGLCLVPIPLPEHSSPPVAPISTILLETFTTLLVAQFSLLSSRPCLSGLFQLDVSQFFTFKQTPRVSSTFPAIQTHSLFFVL